jgi:hypothetical protein
MKKRTKIKEYKSLFFFVSSCLRGKNPLKVEGSHDVARH